MCADIPPGLFGCSPSREHQKVYAATPFGTARTITYGSMASPPIRNRVSRYMRSMFKDVDLSFDKLVVRL